MTYPGGPPGGYPGPGPQQPIPGPGYGPPPGGGAKPGLPQILSYAAAGLGVVNFFIGFAEAVDGGAGYFSQASTVPGLFLLGALFLVPTILPGDHKAGIAPAAFSVVGMLTVLFFTFSSEIDIGVGTILLLIFGIGQGAVTTVLYLYEAGIMKPPQPNQNQYGQPPGMYPPSAPFPAQQPPGGFPPPQPGQQTTFAPQQGQFGQPGHPGTPPGGYPQQ